MDPLLKITQVLAHCQQCLYSFPTHPVGDRLINQFHGTILFWFMWLNKSTPEHPELAWMLFASFSTSTSAGSLSSGSTHSIRNPPSHTQAFHNQDPPLTSLTCSTTTLHHAASSDVNLFSISHRTKYQTWGDRASSITAPPLWRGASELSNCLGIQTTHILVTPLNSPVHNCF